MARRLRIEPHLSVENLEALYREAEEPVRRNQYQAIWLLAKDYPSEKVAELSGYSRGWVRKLAGRYNREGPAALGDRRHRHPGARPILNEAQQRELYEALPAPHPEEGLWNSRLVAQWIFDKTGHKVHAQRGWAYLKRLGFKYTPNPGTVKLTRGRRRRSKKALSGRLPDPSPLSRDRLGAVGL